MKIAIIGGGLAGCALAYVLRQAGQDPVVYEAGASLASGASGNSAGLYNPRFSALRGPESDYYSSAYSMALRNFKVLQDIDWNPCGALHLITDERKEKRLLRTVKNWAWDSEHMRFVRSDEASDLAGVDLQYDALYLPEAGSVSPKKLCEAYMGSGDYHLNTPVKVLEDIQADLKILTCGPSALKFAPDLPLSSVRGQITQAKATQFSAAVKCNLCYDGYLMPAKDGVHTLGATFQPWLDHSEVIEQDNQDNIEKLAATLPGLETGLEVIGQRASVRATSRDHFPVVGAVPGLENVYISAAHGSYGILSSLMAAHLLSDMILERPLCLANDSVAALSPARFK